MTVPGPRSTPPLGNGFRHRLDLAEKPISFVAYRGQVTDSGYSGIFTFEGDWESDLKDKSSIRPNLETLRDAYGIEVVHCDRPYLR